MIQKFVGVILSFTLLIACSAFHEQEVQADQESLKRKMLITGEIAKGRNNYIIRGKTPSEIFTILNPDPKILDEHIRTSKTVNLEVRIVSGDNVNIKLIDGKKYIVRAP